MPKPTEPIRITFDPENDLYQAGISDERAKAPDFGAALIGAASAIAQISGLPAKVIRATVGTPSDWQTKTEPPRSMRSTGGEDETLETAIWQMAHNIVHWDSAGQEWIYTTEAAEKMGQRITQAYADEESPEDPEILIEVDRP